MLTRISQCLSTNLNKCAFLGIFEREMDENGGDTGLAWFVGILAFGASLAGSLISIFTQNPVFWLLVIWKEATIEPHLFAIRKEHLRPFVVALHLGESQLFHTNLTFNSFLRHFFLWLDLLVGPDFYFCPTSRYISIILTHSALFEQ